MRSIVDGTTAAMRRRGLLVLPRRHGPDAADPRGHERPRPLAGRQGQPCLGPGHHRARRRHPDPDRGRGRHPRRTLRVGPWLRHRGPPRDAVGAARLARRRRRGAERPDPGRSALRRRRDPVPRHDRGAAGGHRREGPADGRGRGAAGRVDRPRCGPVRAAERRDPRTPDAAVDRPGLRRPADRGGRGRTAGRGRSRRLARGRGRAARATRPPRRFRSWRPSAARV